FISAIIGATACKKNQSIPASLSVNPSTDTIGGIVTITGSGFSTNLQDNTVMFNDSSFGLVLNASTSQLTVLVPGYATEGRITVKTKGGIVAQTSEIFTIVPKFKPQTESVSYPIYIQTGGGPNLYDYSISFNGAVTHPTAINEDILTVPVPKGATNGKITVNYKGKPYTSFIDFTVAATGTVNTIGKVGAFNSPRGLAVDSAGNIFVCDLQAGFIDKVDPLSGSVSTWAGNGTFSSAGGSPLLNAGVYGSINLAFAPNGDLYTTDDWDGSIMRINGDSAVNLYPSTTFFSTNGIYIDKPGNIYLTDLKMIRKINTDGTVSDIAGQKFEQAFQNGPVSSARFLNPVSLTLDLAGNIYVADQSVIRIISNGYVNTFAGGGGNGQYVDGIYTSAGFLNVNSIVADPATGNIYVADNGSHVVRMIIPTGAVTTIAGNPGNQGHTDGSGMSAQFDSGPWNIALDKSGNLYVTDGSWGAGTVRKITMH
ncbi:MAG TPA: IPT/TIG domain-containing protein, partial [Puia sp.]|nr:IPT/TIG domain-containing protein [Puia sp.]